MAIIITIIIIIVLIFLFNTIRKKKIIREKLALKFPNVWRETLNEKINYYAQLDKSDKQLFEKRVQRFLATKKIEGVNTEIDDAIRLMVASSAVIPTFAFPEYNYPNVQTILIYPESFDEQFHTGQFEGRKGHISGMVGDGFLNRNVILSKPDLVNAFDGLSHNTNVGIHEFVHLLDKEDGAIDGIPEALLNKRFVGPWLKEIKNEIKKIKKGESDINPYALKNNAEFLAVVSEYFLENPKKFQTKHPELYQFLSIIFNQDLSKNSNGN